MTLNNKTLGFIQEINTILNEMDSMTIRQVYYQLVSKHLIPNNINSYKNFDRIAVRGREKGLIDADKIIDTSKPVLIPNQWNNLSDFLNDVKDAYTKNKWQDQPYHVEVWMEKDALRGVFKPITDQYGITLSIGKGYQSFTNLKDAPVRFNGKKTIILYFGDFDPTGLDIARAIEARLKDSNSDLQFYRIALTLDQINEYSLPPIPTKVRDSRRDKFIAEYGDMAVELDALNPNVLRNLIESSIKNYLDSKLYEQSLVEENQDLSELQQLIDGGLAR